MDDVVAARVLCASISAQTRAIENLEKNLSEFGEVRPKPYVEKPRKDGYRAIHLIVRYPQSLLASEQQAMFTMEVQVRTYYQHLWATMSESFGERVKEGGGTTAERRYLAELSQTIASFEKQDSDYVQKDMRNQSNELCLRIIAFEKKAGKVRDSTEFHENEIKSALSYLSMLERRESDQAVEVVLVGASCMSEALKTTHERYYRPKGIPGLPDFLKPSTERPEHVTEPFG